MIWVRVNKHLAFLQLLSTVRGCQKLLTKGNLYLLICSFLYCLSQVRAETSLREISFISVCVSLFSLHLLSLSLAAYACLPKSHKSSPEEKYLFPAYFSIFIFQKDYWQNINTHAKWEPDVWECRLCLWLVHQSRKPLIREFECKAYFLLPRSFLAKQSFIHHLKVDVSHWEEAQWKT